MSSCVIVLSQIHQMNTTLNSLEFLIPYLGWSGDLDYPSMEGWGENVQGQQLEGDGLVSKKVV
jgi:hypothetical protein